MSGTLAAMDMSHGSHGGERGKHDDAAFLFGMIAHHEGALAMAEAVVGKSSDPAVERWATTIIAQQAREIDAMRTLAGQLRLTDSSGAGGAMKQEMDAMLAHPASSDPDINFVKQMVPHHASAVDMALPALAGSADVRVRQLAKDIIAAQAEEIFEFRAWLDKKDAHH